MKLLYVFDLTSMIAIHCIKTHLKFLYRVLSAFMSDAGYYELGSREAVDMDSIWSDIREWVLR